MVLFRVVVVAVDDVAVVDIDTVVARADFGTGVDNVPWIAGVEYCSPQKLSFFSDSSSSAYHQRW